MLYFTGFWKERIYQRTTHPRKYSVKQESVMLTNRHLLWDVKDRKYTLLIPKSKRQKERPEIYRSRERGDVAVDNTLDEHNISGESVANHGNSKYDKGISSKAINESSDESRIDMPDATANMEKENKLRHDKLKIGTLHNASKLKISFWTFGLTKTQRVGVLRDLVKRTPTVDIERLPTDWRLFLRELVKRSRTKKNKRKELHKRAHAPLRQSREYHTKTFPEPVATGKNKKVSTETKSITDAKHQDKTLSSSPVPSTATILSSNEGQARGNYVGDSAIRKDHVPFKSEPSKVHIKEEENQVVTVTPMLKPSVPYSNVESGKQEKSGSGLEEKTHTVDDHTKSAQVTPKSHFKEVSQVPESVCSRDGAKSHIESASCKDNTNIPVKSFEKERKPHGEISKQSSSHRTTEHSHSKHSTTSGAHSSRKNSDKISSSGNNHDRHRSHKVKSSSSHSSSSHSKRESHKHHRKKEHRRSSSSSSNSRDSYSESHKRHSSQCHNKDRHSRERSRSRSRSSSTGRDRNHQKHDKHHRHSRDSPSETHHRSHSSNDILKSTQSLTGSPRSKSPHSAQLPSSNKKPSDNNDSSLFSQLKQLSKSNSATTSSKSNVDSTPDSAIAAAETPKIAQTAQKSDSQTQAAIKLKWEQSIKKRMKEQKSHIVPFKKVSPLLVHKKDSDMNPKVSKVFDGFKEPVSIRTDKSVKPKESVLKNRSFIDVFRTSLPDPSKKDVHDYQISSHNISLKKDYETNVSESGKIDFITLDDNGIVVQDTGENVSADKSVSGMKLPVLVQSAKEGRKPLSTKSDSGTIPDTNDENKENSDSQKSVRLDDSSPETEVSTMEASNSTSVPPQLKNRPSSQADSEATEGKFLREIICINLKKFSWMHCSR